MNEKDFDPIDVARFKKNESIVRALGNAAKANIAQGANTFQSHYLLTKRIAEVIVAEVMYYCQAVDLFHSLLLIATVRASNLEDFLLTVKKYEGYFDSSAISVVEFYINFSQEVEVPNGLESAVKGSALYSSRDFNEKREEEKICLDFESVRILKEYQEKIQQYISAAKDILMKIDDVRMSQWI